MVGRLLYKRSSQSEKCMHVTPVSMCLCVHTACVAQLAKASDTQAVGREFKARPDH